MASQPLRVDERPRGSPCGFNAEQGLCQCSLHHRFWETRAGEETILCSSLCLSFQTDGCSIAVPTSRGLRGGLAILVKRSNGIYKKYHHVMIRSTLGVAGSLCFLTKGDNRGIYNAQGGASRSLENACTSKLTAKPGAGLVNYSHDFMYNLLPETTLPTS